MAVFEYLWWFYPAIMWTLVLAHPFIWWLTFEDLNGFLGNSFDVTRADIFILRDEVAMLEKTLNDLRANDD